MTTSLVRSSKVFLNGGWTPQVGASAPVPDFFIPDVTKPVWLGHGNPANNVGNKYNVELTDATSVTQADYAIHENKTVLNWMGATHKGQTFINCRFVYSHNADTTGGQFYQMISATNGIKTNFLFCEFEPGIPKDRYDAIYGHDIYAYRSVMFKQVDGVGIANTTHPDVNVELASCWMGYPAWAEDDYTPSRQNGHSDLTGSHNDIAAQHFSGKNVRVHGCFLQGAKYNYKNPLNCILDEDTFQDYILQNGNGIDVLFDVGVPNTGPTAHHGPWASQAYLGQHSAYYKVGNIEFDHNWLWNFDNGFKVQSNRTASVSPEFVSGYSEVLNVSVHDNIFGGKWRNWGGSLKYYPIRYDTNCQVNGSKRVTGSYTDIWNNIWDPTARVDATYGDGSPIAGQPVRHRVDSAPAA